MKSMWRRIDALLRSRSINRDLDDELRFHLEMKERETGDPAAARRAVGSPLLWRERARDAWGWPWADDLLWDLRYAMRVFRRSPGFTAMAIAMLALGVGVNAMVFTVTNSVLFKGFPLVKDNHRLLYITMGPRGGCCVSYPDFEDWRAQATSFGAMAIVRGVRASLSDPTGFPEQVDATEVSAGTFALVGQRPAMGRDFMPSDEIEGAAPVAILQDSFWESRFGGDPAIVGRAIRINGAPTTIIGVMPPGFAFPQKQELWIPMVRTPRLQRREARDTWMVVGRLAPGSSIVTARAEMEAIGKRLESAYPLTNRGQLPVVQTFTEFYIGENAAILYSAMWGAVSFVLLIACANLANLLLARAIVRSHEISIRIALGAGRWRIVRQLLIESVMLSGVGGFFGWWIAKWGTFVYIQTLAAWLRPFFDSSADYTVLGYLVAISIATGLLFGLAPAARLSRMDVNTALKGAARGTIGPAKHLSRLLVIAEMALAVVLLAGAGVMIRSFLKIYATDLGIHTDNVEMVLLSVPVSKYPKAADQTAFYDRLTARLATIPGIKSIALTNFRPTGGSRRVSYELAGSPPVDERSRPQLSALVISPAYFRTLEATLLSGRDFAEADGPTSIPVAIVNQLLASNFWPNQDPLGKRLRLLDGEKSGPWLTVVGVVSNIVQNGVTRQQIAPLIYLPFRQNPGTGMTVLARTAIPSSGLVTTLQREIHAADPDLITYSTWALDDYLRLNYQSRGISAGLFLIMAVIALLLASMGLYAVVAHSVSQRTQEIGVRMAVGAGTADILRLVFRQGMCPLAIGLAIGLATSVAANRILAAQLVQVSPSDPVTLAATSGVLALAAALGCLIPARRAIRIDPVSALRHE